MHNRYIRDLPFPPTSFFSPEMVRQIKAIPLEDIPYSEEEITWMERAVSDMDRHLESMIRHAELGGRSSKDLLKRKAEYEMYIRRYRTGSMT